jgi:hypothetical protein
MDTSFQLEEEMSRAEKPSFRGVFPYLGYYRGIWLEKQKEITETSARLAGIEDEI